MGCGASKNTPDEAGSGPHPGVPVDPVPYAGPSMEHRILDLECHASRNFMGSLKADVDDSIQILSQQYAEYFKLDTFFRVPFHVAFTWPKNHKLNFQGIFSRPLQYVASPEIWQLEARQVNLNHSDIMEFGITGQKPRSDIGAMLPIINMVNERTSLGARLVCVESNCNIEKSGLNSITYGYNLFFNAPLHTNPIVYTTLACGSVMKLSHGLFSGSITCSWDNFGLVNQYLNEGWKLVDITIPQHEVGLMYGRRGFKVDKRDVELAVIWFFEKDSRRVAANDNTPLYQATVLSVNIKATGPSCSATSKVDATRLIEEMGNKGWSLSCVVPTPSKQGGNGYVLLYFQRPLVAQQ